MLGVMEEAALVVAPETPLWLDRARAMLARYAPGLVLSLVVALAATYVGVHIPIVGGPVAGIVLGAALGGLVRPGAHLRPGLTLASKNLLQASIVVLGTGLSLSQVARVGAGSLPVMFGTLTVALTGAWLFGRLLGVHGDARTLIGVGTGICGASAIAATTAVIAADEVDVAYAIGTIFTFNVAAVLLFPLVGHLLGLSQHAFGLWSGTAINDTSSVVAASYSYGATAGAYGVVVKLTRSLMIVPIAVGLGVWRARRDPGRNGRLRLPLRRMFPMFILGFLVAAAVNSAGLIPTGWHASLGAFGVFLITVALAGIGLGIEPATIRRAGHRPLLLGALLWVAVALTSLGLQALTGTL